jgi:hypothetical protein
MSGNNETCQNQRLQHLEKMDETRLWINAKCGTADV